MEFKNKRVAIVHVPYQVPGGEEVYVRLLARAYERLGFKVGLFPLQEAPAQGPLRMLQSLNPFYRAPENEFYVEGEIPDLIHLNHVYPTLGLIPHRWALHHGVPLIQTVHNHRFYCTNGLALRGSKICTSCRESRLPWRSLVYNCNDDYKKSAYYTLALTAMNRTFGGSRNVWRFVAPSPYIEEELVKYGFPQNRVHQMYHPIDVPNLAQLSVSEQKIDVLYAGRLSQEKGIEVLIEVARQNPDLKFAVTGAGPLSQVVSAAASEISNLQYLGKLDRAEVMEKIQEAKIGIMPSLCYESFGFFAAECFWYGKRCVVSDLRSSDWMNQTPFLGLPVDTTSPKAIAEGIRKALKMPKPQEAEVEAIRGSLGFDRFCDDLLKIARETIEITKRPKVLVLHIPYEHRGGEDIHVETLMDAYRRVGYEPVLYPDNRRIGRATFMKAVTSLLYSPYLKRLEQYMKLHKPEFIHVHNVFPIMGPSFYRWAINKKIKLVMTIHNHRFFCANGVALRNNKICKDCFGAKIKWRPVLYNCNQNFAKSSYYALALTQLEVQNLLNRAVTHFVAPSPYIQNELIRSGISKEKISCVFNPIAEAAFVAPLKDKPEEKFDVLFAGRISPEKGVFNLIEAAKLLPKIRFGIVGNGPDRDRLIDAIKTVTNVQYLGFVSNARVNELIQSSRLSVLPSVCNEVLPTFVLESFMQGKHCVVPSLESTRWLVEDGYPGYSAATESPAAIATAISEGLEKPEISEVMVSELRERFGIVRFCTELGGVAEKVRMV